MLVRLLTPLALSPFVRHNLRRFLSVVNHKDLIVLSELAEARKLTPVIDRTYPLDEAAAALTYIERGHARGQSRHRREQRFVRITVDVGAPGRLCAA